MLPAPQTFSLKKHGGKVSNINELSVKPASVVSADPLELCPQCHSKSMSVQEVMLKLKGELTDTIDNVEKIGQRSSAKSAAKCMYRWMRSRTSPLCRAGRSVLYPSWSSTGLCASGCLWTDHPSSLKSMRNLAPIQSLTV